MAQDRLKVIYGHLKQRAPQSISFQPTSAVPALEASHQFEYTLDNPRLTSAQRAFYEENGFLVIPDLVSHEILDECRQRFLDIIEGRVDLGGMTRMRDISLKGLEGVSQERVVNKIQDFCWDDVLTKHTIHPRILDYVECFVGSNVQAMHTMLINKPPDPGTRTSRHPMHQDLHYFPFRPANRIVCAWTAMEEVTSRNGCLFVVPGSHKGTLQQHEYPEWENGVNKMYHGVRGFDESKKTLLEMEKGDTVFFHPLLLHGSGANRTDRFRKAISCHYASSDCHYIDVRGTTQENIAKEVEQIAEKRGGHGLDFQALWNMRSRLVRGRGGTLSEGP